VVGEPREWDAAAGGLVHAAAGAEQTVSHLAHALTGMHEKNVRYRLPSSSTRRLTDLCGRPL